MKIFKIFLSIVFFAAILFLQGWFGPYGGRSGVDNSEERKVIWDGRDAEKQVEASEKENLIVLQSPRPGTIISSPVRLVGKARGNWFFEASFPVSILDWDGKVIGQGYAEARPDSVTGEVNWMTTDFVEFEGLVIFDVSKIGKAYYPERMHRGYIVLHKDNPSVLPENDDKVEIPILFR